MSERKLVGTNEMFKKALAGGYAIGAYNVNNMEILQGIAEAAPCRRPSFRTPPFLSAPAQ